MSVKTDRLSDTEIEDLFNTPATLPGETFEIGLVLGGTVSAGAYTAGVVDFLLEALDSFYDAQRSGNPDAPPHKIRLSVMVGSSGGGVNAAIAARALAYDYPRIVRSTPIPAGLTGNPFYDVWVKTLTLEGFLGADDIAGGVVSLLNGKPIDDGAGLVATFASASPMVRDYVADPLRVMLTLTNLRGVPYRTDFGGGLSETFINYCDHIRFAVSYTGKPMLPARPDELWLGFEGARLPNATSWDDFSKFARATAAFPLGFPPRELVRPTEHYRYRVALVPQENGTTKPVALTPDWDALKSPGDTAVPDDYHFVSVDGGTTDNEPIELARSFLSGVTGRNARDGATANKAVLLIDPFAGTADLGPSSRPTLLEAAGDLMTTLVGQSRYDSSDLLLATDDTVFSRYMITPRRNGLVGGDAIAANGLGAFIGFACADFMRHDYFLGRANCQEFLRKTFALPPGNPLFKNWTAPQKAAGIKTTGGQWLPVIPLLGVVAIDESTEPWPKHKLNPETYRTAIEARFKAIAEAEGKGSVISTALTWIGANVADGKVADFVIGKIAASLAASGLA